MSKKKMFLNLVLDESASMLDSRMQTVNGFNEYIDDQKKTDEVSILVSLTKFNDQLTQVFTARPVDDVEHLNDETYQPSGMTALYDAIAKSIKQTELSLQRENKSDVKVIVVIFTDGQENVSREFCGPSGLANIKKMITDREKEGNWTFVFLGTDMDAWSAGQEIGVATANVMRVARSKTANLYKAISASTSHQARAFARGQSLSDGFFESNKEDYKDIDKDEEQVNQSKQHTGGFTGQWNNMRNLKDK